ncbi:Nitroreductase [Sporobacter termitidis DSM 10068]|uniref:Nitroreductase n=1 Tax=Sporobacter termitidis DSM 10068 TaxID=1123282 RepID=A0A1M5ZBW0_9FIRM|nr:nitroreductase family protein [Sporobacter termitidis]SHI21649.1 Nitroreductase [Sporobacter termitidis DSM 10068]
MEALEAILKRKSVRSYKTAQISDKDLEAILEAGKSGPGGGAYHLSVIQKPELLKKINDATKQAMLAGGGFMKERASLPGYEPVYGAPTLILLSAADTNGIANASCSAENMLVAATALGLGSCYLMSVRGAFAGEGGAALLRECGVPEGNTVNCAVIAGYQDGEAFASSAPKVRTVNYVK